VDSQVSVAPAAEDVAPSVERVLARHAQRRPHAPALVFPGGPPITYRRLHEQVQAVAAALRGAGLRADDRVAAVLPNGPAMAVAFLGAATAAACAPLNPAFTAVELDFYLEDLDARAVIVPSKGEVPVREVARKRGIAVLELSVREAPGAWTFALDGRAEASAPPYEPCDPHAAALVLHTSGTTSRPKMIPLSHANLCASAAAIQTTLRLDEDDRCLNVMPLFHIHGLVGALLASLAGGGSVVCTPGFSPVQFFGWLEEFRPTWYTAVPTMHHEVLARAAVNRDVIARCRPRFIRSCSAPLPADVLSGLERVFEVPVIEAYGMTEASHQIASNPLPPARRKPGSVGRPTECEVAILDEDGRPRPEGEAGEIAIRGPGVTAARGGGWLRTGDVGFMDADGYLFISGRIKEIINRGGEKISPLEVDRVLLEHPAVAQAVTCAVPDKRLGEDVIAVIVPRAGVTLTEREVREFASVRLAPVKVPRRVMFVEQIPKGPTGKIQRIGLAEKLGIESLAFAQPGGSAPLAAPRTPTEVAIAQVWSEVLGIGSVGLHDNFFELGGDSLAGVDVIARLEARLGLTIAIRDLGYGTLQQVAAGCDEQAPRTDARARGGHGTTKWMRKLFGPRRRDE
jgi:acyl-CoA synthetase (AMP-forming)/AMP-acid ligase II/acyl carrier protein